MSSGKAYAYILLGAALWGIIGIFVHSLYAFGFNPMEVVAIRVSFASVFLLLYALIKNKRIPKIQWRDSKYFIGTGILSIVFFNLCLFYSIGELGLSVASILLYTAPAFVTLFSAFLFKEKVNWRKGTALVFTLTGCMLVAGIFPSFHASMTIMGFLAGIGSGLGYALYSVFGKYALAKYSSMTVTAYTFIFAAVFMIPVSGLWDKTNLFLNGAVWVNVLGLGLLSTVFSYILYTKGLEIVEASRASIVATIEPVVATLAGIIIYHETLSLWQIAGILLILSAVFVVSEKTKKRRKDRAVPLRKTV
ncbi:DMT family transporter [Falsibacillus pallidus]|uniref:Threonine/homoserine efflux transporter RhtA n=1 Tax=Falsibacillus pallidus TaxID=493781 RepID=A0A370GQZ1_9BACI|nr:DMT family transporter [Falsibacillus pallidus]RDI45921.1 threonine/homoserine efflux transporter RhtA [Falsibacillus pallidus]